MSLDYEMEYTRGSERQVCVLHANSDEEAVDKAKKQFLDFCEYNDLPKDSQLLRVYRSPKNLLDKVYSVSITKAKDIFSLKEK